MSWLIDFFFCSIPASVSEEQRTRDRHRRVKRIVSSLARGNVSLQRGDYITSPDIERLREANRIYDFSK
ncbi:MAG: hypothetical protein ACRC46_12340 [Thermoguttaceae bacterium]